ncbi:hypothetical protein FIA58_000885 [Flavobacterium jejuense]|uniref:Uncharacterized protein n=1 Tax=Flavobacterium jejuense TaxID=1544455 RepID=A0ABX0IKH2_9FLAO|nr:hypothetical protein [Flavobacterium jejuense]NHN24218.1 hypothetical protein [Flavobacterium jejuense]
MANLRKFFWEGLQSGMKVDYYTNRWPRVGNGKAEVIETLRVKLSGEIRLGGIFTVEIIMPDESLRGFCTLIVNGEAANDCAYLVEGNKLNINHPQSQIQIHANDKKWTWAKSSHPQGLPWMGMWPSDMKMDHEDNFGDVE